MNKVTVMEMLNDTTQPKWLGQHLSYYPSDYAKGYQLYFSSLQAAYGKRPYLPGLTVGLGSTLADCKAAIDYLKVQGYTVLHLDHHANNPWTNGDPWDCSYTNLAHLNELPAWNIELARLCDLFLYAKQQGLVLWWRPFHEANSNRGFWWDWGCAGQQVAPFKAAWHYMFNRFANAGCDNLLWVYSPLAMGWTDIYTDMAPAINEFDVVAVDLYSNTATLPKNSYAALLSLGVPVGFGECGPESGNTDAALWLNAVKSVYPQMRFLQFWHNWDTVTAALAGADNAGILLNDNSILTTAVSVTPLQPVAHLTVAPD